MNMWCISYRDPGRDEVALVQNKDEMLPGFLLFHVVLDALGARSHGITGVQHLDDDIRRVDHLLEENRQGAP